MENYIEDVSSLASGFGFDSDDDFNDYCDEMESAALAQIAEDSQ